MHKHRFAIGILLLVSVLFGGILSSPYRVSAQVGSKATPSPEESGGRVYDKYPHAQTRGAIRYSLADKWNKTNLTYQFLNCPSRVNCDDAQVAVRQAFDDWASVSVLTFSEVSGGADIEIAWAGEEEDMGPGSDTLGFAYFPSEGGDMFLSDSIDWEFGTGTDDDLYLTAAHEIGHALGLDHSSDEASLMYPTATDETTGIASDDIEGIQQLYGESDGSGPTLDVDNTPTDISLDDSDTDDEFVMSDGALDDNTPYELWEIEVEESETLVITMRTVAGDLVPYLGVWTDDEDTVLAESSSDSDTEASVIVTFPDAGIYVIMATRDGVEEGSSAGDYTLAIETASAEDVQTSGSSSSGGTMEIINFAETDLCELYLSPTEGKDWGDDLLDGTPLADGEAVSSDFQPGSYDVLAVTCDGDEIEEYELSVSRGSSIEIYTDIIEVYP